MAIINFNSVTVFFSVSMKRCKWIKYRTYNTGMVFVILHFSFNFFSVLFLNSFYPFSFHCKFQVVLTKRFLVRPNGQIGEKEQNNKKERTSTPETVTSAASTITEPAQSAPEFSFDETVLQKVGTPLKDVIEQVNITGMQIFLFILITIPFTFMHAFG